MQRSVDRRNQRNKQFYKQTAAKETQVAVNLTARGRRSTIQPIEICRPQIAEFGNKSMSDEPPPNDGFEELHAIWQSHVEQCEHHEDLFYRSVSHFSNLTILLLTGAVIIWANTQIGSDFWRQTGGVALAAMGGVCALLSCMLGKRHGQYILWYASRARAAEYAVESCLSSAARDRLSAGQKQQMTEGANKSSRRTIGLIFSRVQKRLTDWRVLRGSGDHERPLALIRPVYTGANIVAVFIAIVLVLYFIFDDPPRPKPDGNNAATMSEQGVPLPASAEPTGQVGR
jgi:hypothetical protein